ncbi:survival motor neuron interacting protein 1-domain-containing protein [Neocallimastix lanati (nom. inval.)]|uniref:Gem-associated protein 2 n=1 Tax=Neocallimastix californiae TaxID=1754190 RepID=A0A1Y2CEB0_9FUNG|nr:survival motor neuron interacting protein 1-domain-containing protein [Neocallimastix sp. JGI-2020a]ORY45379.1 hypothetical protein LY90DRAFT_671503 [Neocallimastix californiae]|eukprot:ORY45379.1 hypothetical protein LY90DRAFT_671503 [Neocallimastix californiae]
MKKLKFQILNDEYEYYNNKNVLPISEIPLNLIPKGPPKTGEIYLRLVHEEAKKCPKVVRKALPKSKEVKITKDTKNINYLRKYFNRFEEEEKKIFNEKCLPDNCNKELFPALEDESKWKVYLYGKSKRGLKKINLNLLNEENNLKENEGENDLILNEVEDLNSNIIQENKKRKLIELNNENKKKLCIENENINSNEGIDYHNNNINNIKLNKKIIEGREPLLTIVKQMNQKIINRIIYYHSLWIKSSITKKQYQWLYALLIGLDPLLTSSQISVLRDICKLCINQREQLYKNTIEYKSLNIDNLELNEKIKNDLIEEVAPLNIIITIITVFFSQSDLE